MTESLLVAGVKIVLITVATYGRPARGALHRDICKLR